MEKKFTADIQTDIGIVHRYETPRKYEIGETGVTIDLQYQAWPSVISDENGVLYAFASGRRFHVDPFGHTLMYKSYDNGVTWSEPIIANDTPMDDRDVGALYLGNGKILISYFRIAAWDLMADDQKIITADGYEVVGTSPARRNEKGEYMGDYISWQTEEFTTPEQVKAVLEYWSTMNKDDLEGGIWTLISEDYGKTWSAPRRSPISTPHGPILRRDGSLLYIGRGWLDQYDGDAIYAFTSDDLGETWQYRTTLYKNNNQDVTYCEPHVVELDDGRLVVGIRVQGSYIRWEGNLYAGAGFSHEGIPVYGSQGKVFTRNEDGSFSVYDGPAQWACNRTYFRLATCISDDGGFTWTKPEFVKVNDPTGLLEVTGGYVYGSPPHMLLLKNGAILMTHCSRSLDIGERAVISYDRGESWENEFVLCNKPYDAAPDGKGGRYYRLADIGYPATVETADGGLLSVYYQACPEDRYTSILYTKWFLT